MTDAKKKKNLCPQKNRRAEKEKYLHLTVGLFTSTCLNLEQI